MTSPFGQRLSALIADRGPLCVGIDPHPSVLRSWGLEADLAGLERCARGMVEALGGTVPVFKPQSAFFEAFGAGDAEVAASVVTGADRPSAASAWSAPESGRISTAPVAPTTITEATASSVTFRRGLPPPRCRPALRPCRPPERPPAPDTPERRCVADPFARRPLPVGASSCRSV